MSFTHVGIRWLSVLALLPATGLRGSDVVFTVDEGSWDSPLSWNDGAGPVPGAGDAAVFEPGEGNLQKVWLAHGVTQFLHRMRVHSGTVEMGRPGAIFGDLAMLWSQNQSFVTPALVVQSSNRGETARLNIEGAVSGMTPFRIILPSGAIGKDAGRHGELTLSSQNWTLDLGVRLDVGRAGTGFVDNGGSSRVIADRMEFGVGMNAWGTFICRDDAKTIADDTVIVGAFGGGDLAIMDGGRLEAQRLIVARSEGSVGSLVVEHPGSLLVVDDLLEVGQFGDATMEVRGGAGVIVLHLLSIAWGPMSGGTVTIEDPQSHVWILGDVMLAMANAVSMSPQLHLKAGGRIRAEGAVGLNETRGMVHFTVADAADWQSFPAIDARGGIFAKQFILDVADDFQGTPGDRFILARTTHGPIVFDQSPQLTAPAGRVWVISEEGSDLVATLTVTADLNGDGVVDSQDLLLLLAAWGACPDGRACPADLNGDGIVDSGDLIELLSSFSPGS